MKNASVKASDITERILTVAFEPGAATLEQLKALEALVKNAPGRFKGVKIQLVPIK